MFEITIDKREQRPWSFSPEVAKVRMGTVRTGDYCVTGDKGFAVERKSLNDFLGTISTGWDRFKREINRASVAGFHLPVIVEARFSDILFAVQNDGTITPPQHDHPRLTPGFVLKRIGEMEMLGASARFADGPVEAAMLAAALLFQRYQELHGDEE
jgi:hypothetical protein